MQFKKATSVVQGDWVLFCIPEETTPDGRPDMSWYRVTNVEIVGDSVLIYHDPASEDPDIVTTEDEWLRVIYGENQAVPIMSEADAFGGFMWEEPDDFLRYIRNTLIPDIKADGRTETARDFERLLEIIDSK